MNFSLCRPVKILLLGAGGTGGYVAPHLYRLMHTLNRTVRINIVDGDLVEAKNLVRQNFCAADLGENKAKVLATRYSEAFGMETLYHPAFLEKDEDLYRMVQPGDIWLDGKRVPELSILIGCVDNNKSRQMCHRVFERSSHLVYIDSGNDEFSGQVVCGIRCNRRTIYKPVCKLYPDMLEETDKFPSELSCAEAAVSAPQSITANIMAATVVTDFVYNIVARGKLTTRYAVFSAASINVRAESNKKDKGELHNMEKGICLIERLYVPYGQTVRFETLRVDKLIVDGNLIVEGKISAVWFCFQRSGIGQTAGVLCAVQKTVPGRECVGPDGQATSSAAQGRAGRSDCRFRHGQWLCRRRGAACDQGLYAAGGNDHSNFSAAAGSECFTNDVSAQQKKQSS